MLSINKAASLSEYKFKQIEVEVDEEQGVLWVYQKPSPRPCFNPELIQEVRTVQLILEMNNGNVVVNNHQVKIHYFVLDSLSPDIFSMGGDLDYFRDHIVRKDKEGLLKYAKSCIDTIHAFIVGFNLPITTISLVRGDALGGGFEVAMSNQVVIAEKGVEMGFPEILFNLFPGMGGYHLLCKRLPAIQVDKMMLNGQKYNSEKLYEMGVVDHLSEKGEGREAVYSFIEQSSRYRNGFTAMQRVHQMVNPLTWRELMDVCEYWVEIAMNLTNKDLRLMDKLVKAQNKKSDNENQQANIFKHQRSA